MGCYSHAVLRKAGESKAEPFESLVGSLRIAERFSGILGEAV